MFVFVLLELMFSTSIEEVKLLVLNLRENLVY
jgi:hypothetical protein